MVDGEAVTPMIFGGKILKRLNSGEVELPGTLIIGYENMLRGDDAVGCRAAYQLEQFFRDDPEVNVIASQQLTPEMAEDVAGSDFVLFLDAAMGEKPGTLRRTPIAPQPGPSGFTHQLTPGALLSAAEQLYGDVPQAMSITLAGWSFDLSNRLSPGAGRRFPEMIRLAQDAVESHRRRAPVERLAPTK
jgi:hydrogenase maturation protease